MRFALGLIHIIKMYERLTIKAYLERSKKTAIKAMLLHPLGPNVEEAQQLLEDILMANKGFIDLQ